MKVLLSRWQFGVTITYHFLFVPLTIGLALLVAVMQVEAYRTKDEAWERLTRFFGTLFLINFAMGIVTGIAQELQFGMNWSNYSVFVGNIFGAPLAMEGLLAFFAESTFVGLWIFGRNRLPPLAHTLCICLVSLGTIVSAFFILTANAWMQHPVGYRIVGHGAGRKAELTDFWAVLRNSTLWAEFSHTVLAAFVTGAMFVLGISAWQLLRGNNVAAFTRSARLEAAVALVCVVLVDRHRRHPGPADGHPAADEDGRRRGRLQDPFRGQLLAAHHREPVRPAHLPDPDPAPAQPDRHPVLERQGHRHHRGPARRGVALWPGKLRAGAVGHLLGLPHHGRAGVPDPDHVGVGAVAISRRGATKPLELGRWTLRVLLACIAARFLANTAGWIFTEMERQPWIVFGLLKTGAAGSPSVSLADVALTLGGFTLLYTVLGIIDVGLMYRAARGGLATAEELPPSPAAGGPGERAQELIY